MGFVKTLKVSLDLSAAHCNTQKSFIVREDVDEADGREWGSGDSRVE